MSLVSFLLSATVTWLAQSNAILQKNFISLYKKPAFVLFAILSPCLGPIILAACFIAIPASGSSSQFQVDYTQSIPFSLDTCPDNCPFIYYTPTTSKHDKIMSILAAANPTLKIGVNIIPCTNELDMSSKIINNQNMIFNYFYAGVSFTDKNTSVLTAYSIWEKESTYNSPYQSQTYALQNQLDSAIISFTTNKPSSSNAILKFFTPQGTKRTYETKAKSGYSGPNVANLFTSTLSTVILPFFFFPILSLSLTIVATEKRLKLLHPLRRMGLFESAYWVSNLIPIIVVCLMASVAFVITTYIAGAHMNFALFSNSIDLNIVFQFSKLLINIDFAYSISLASMGLCIAAVFSRPLYLNLFQGFIALGVIVSSFVLFSPLGSLSIIPFWLTLSSSSWGGLIMLIFPPIGHAMIWNNIINVIQPGIFNNQTASNFTMQTYSDNTKLQNISTSLYLVGTPLYDAWEMNRTSSTVTGILVGSIFFFLTLAFYLNQALESEEGFSLPFYFPFTISYWTGVKKAVKKSGEFFGDSVEEERNASLKSESVRIHKITKVFKNTTAVKEFSLAMEKGNVYGLLGHNGSGKTTTINILSGVTNPTYGNAFVFGYDVLTEINFIRSQMGVCSQFDLLYPRMTGAQHVAFYARFRNANLNGLSMELFVNTKLETVQLIEAKDQEVHGYSGGMKRRLSVALSTIGNDLKLIFLDEPTTGLDPLSKRKVWKVIENLKKDKIVVLTTHSMEEADFLADFICIMHSGKLKASGTPLFLKNNYGNGYQVSILKKESISLIGPSQTAPGTSLMEKWIVSILPGSEIISSAAGAITIGVGKGSFVMLTRFLRVLQKDKTVEWSISNSTLEEVFLKLCSLFEGVNAHAAKESEKAACLICVRKPTESVFLFTALGIKVFVANVVCRSCAEGTTTNDPGSIIGGEMIDFNTFQSLNNSQPQQIAAQTTRQLMQPQQNEYDLKNVSQVAILSSQVKAIVLKNFILDYRLWKTNCCTILLILILNGLLAFISSSLSGGYDRISERCPGGFTYFDQNSYTRKCNPMSFMASSSCTSSLSTNQFFSNSICKSYTGVYSELSPLVGGSTYQDSYSSYSLKAVSYYFRSNYSDYYTSRISYMQNKGRIWYTDSSASGDVTLQSVLDPTFFRFTNLSQSKTILLSSFPEFRKISTSVDSAVTSAQLNLQSLANSNNKCGILGSIFTSADVLNVLSIINDSYPDVGLNIKSFNPKSNQFSVELFYMPLSSALKSFPSAYITQNDDYYSEQNPTVCYGYGWADQIYASSNYLQRFTDDPTRGILNTLANSLLRSSLNLPPLTYNLLNNSSETPIILANFSRMPQFFTDSNSNPLQTFVNSISIAIILLATMFMLPRLVALWVNERVLHLTEMMRVQGLYTSTYWAANYIYGMLTVGLCTFLSFVITLAIQPVLQNNAGLVIIVFIIWIHSQVCLSILISSVFKKPVTASMISYLFIIISVIVTLFLLFIMSGPLGDIIPIAANIFPPIAFASALNLCMNAGFGFNTRYSIIVAIFFFASTGIGMLGIYLHLIQPGQLGVAAMDPFFGLVKLVKKKRGDRQLEAGKVDDDKSLKIDEDVLKEMKFCRETIEKSDPMSAVKIANLRKVYGTKKIAVKDVSLNIQFGEVFGLLGPNGAGKSTTIACVTGLTHATSGTVKIADENIENVKNLWRLVGLCPQHDTIWPDLTIEDHLLFYCRLRGIPRERINGTVRRIAEDVGLDGDPFRQFASQMSGGMKRRLSIAIAMTASPKILILDEPTTGLDPDTRHKIWKVINKIAESKDRSIIITTHSMEEADALCSRIGIVCEGRLQVIGNQVHLKNKIGSGIKLTLVITMESAIDSLTEFEKNFEIIENKALEKINVQILKLICSQAIFFSKSKTHLPSLLSKLNGQSKMAIWNSTMTFVLPTEGLDIASIFERIDERKNEMMIVDWSLSQTTMEDVFIKVVEGAMRDK